MYGLPKDFDCLFLVGRTLEMICFAQHQAYLHFSERVTISIESSISYITDEIVDLPILKSNLMELIGCSISAAEGFEDGTLSLVFDNGKQLNIFDTSKQYESYQITYEGKTVNV